MQSQARGIDQHESHNLAKKITPRNSAPRPNPVYFENYNFYAQLHHYRGGSDRFSPERRKKKRIKNSKLPAEKRHQHAISEGLPQNYFPSPSWRVFCILIKWVLYQFNNLIQSCAEFGPKPRLVNARVQVMMTRTVRLSVITFLKGSINGRHSGDDVWALC